MLNLGNKEQDKSGITSADIKFMKRTTKHRRQDCEINEDILSELKINSDVKKIQNYKNK
jgi:hypothetical protein